MYLLPILTLFSTLVGHTLAQVRINLQPYNNTGNACPGSIQTYLDANSGAFLHVIDRIPVAIGPGIPIESARQECTIILYATSSDSRSRIYLNKNTGYVNGYLNVGSGINVIFRATYEWISQAGQVRAIDKGLFKEQATSLI
jgi:hypothetical protein